MFPLSQISEGEHALSGWLARSSVDSDLSKELGLLKELVCCITDITLPGGFLLIISVTLSVSEDDSSNTGTGLAIY